MSFMYKESLYIPHPGRLIDRDYECCRLNLI